MVTTCPTLYQQQCKKHPAPRCSSPMMLCRQLLLSVNWYQNDSFNLNPPAGPRQAHFALECRGAAPPTTVHAQLWIRNHQSHSKSLTKCRPCMMQDVIVANSGCPAGINADCTAAASVRWPLFRPPSCMIPCTSLLNPAEGFVHDGSVEVGLHLSVLTVCNIKALSMLLWTVRRAAVI